MKVESIAECSFCNTADLHLAIIGLENPFLVFFRVAVLDRFYCIKRNTAWNGQYENYWGGGGINLHAVTFKGIAACSFKNCSTILAIMSAYVKRL